MDKFENISRKPPTTNYRGSKGSKRGEWNCSKPKVITKFNVSWGKNTSVFSQKVVTRHNCVLSKQPIKSLN